MIILMGIAGAGKGTQAKMLVEKNGFSLVSTGDLFRAYATEDQHRRMLAGELLRDDEIFEMIGSALSNVPNLQQCVLDGTPRSIPQADWLLDQVKQGYFEITAIVHIAVTEEVVHSRLINRGRSDDTESGIAKRFEEYRNNTMPILHYMEEKGIKVCEVNGNQDPNAVHEDILQCIR